MKFLLMLILTLLVLMPCLILYVNINTHIHKNYIRPLSLSIDIVITIVERDTGKYHKFIAKYCYECKA